MSFGTPLAWWWICVALVAPVSARSVARADAPTSVLLVILDDVGVEKLAVYAEPQPAGEPVAQTPTIDALAGIGVAFRNVHANPTCSATRMQLLTGRHGFRTGVHTFIGFDGGNTNYAVPDSERFLPEVLRDGFPPGADPRYRSGLFGKWHLAPEVGGALCDPIENGFELFVGQIGNHTDHFGWPQLRSIAAPGSATCLAVVPGALETTWSAAFVRHEAEQWIASETRPFLAVVAFHPPHGPLQVPPLVADGEPTVSAGTWAELQAVGLDQPGRKVPGPFPCSLPPAQTT